MRVSAVILGAGEGRRLGGRVRKALVALGGRPLFAYSVEAFARVPEVGEIILVLHPRDVGGVQRRYRTWLAGRKVRTVIAGGRTRSESSRRGLRAADPRAEVVLVHDAARPLVAADLIRRVIRGAAERGAAVPGVPVSDTLKRVGAGGRVIRTVPREGLVAVQTPQGFSRRALDRIARRGIWRREVTDDAQWAEAAGVPVQVVDGDPRNRKITTGADLARAERLGVEVPRSGR